MEGEGHGRHCGAGRAERGQRCACGDNGPVRRVRHRWAGWSEPGRAGPGGEVMEACGVWPAGLAVVGRGRRPGSCAVTAGEQRGRGFIRRFLGT